MLRYHRANVVIYLHRVTSV